MATLKYFIKGNSNISTIYLRLVQGRNVDLKKSTSLLINSNYWNNKKGEIRQIAEFENKLNLKNDLNDLSNHVLNSFNNCYANGVLINSEWLNDTIKSFFNQSEDVDFNYFVDYAEYFHTNLKNKVQKTGVTGVTIATEKKYRTIINKVKDFEKYKKKKVKLIDIGLKFHKDFIHFLHDVQQLNFNTTGKYLVFVKTICLDAKKYGLKINPDIEKEDFRPTKEKVSFITLNEDEIQTIFNHDFKKTPYLENARNWLIIGVWTGARVSDLLKFTKKNVSNGFIEYTAIKTNQKIVLPLHPQVKEILERLNGEFPKQISNQKFNDYIKLVCQDAKIENVVLGAKQTKIKEKVWRKTKGEFKKYELVSTHICRRSFATNHYGKLPTPVIMAVTGHTTEAQFLKYVGKTAKDNADVLNDFWQVQDKLKNQKAPVMEVILNDVVNN
ncbi:tyrosine-type recombinase/integrase [Flavobacterium orientale]|uniref:Transposase n=1 Tax=Flavobacterium orientale TaxID=1756020 RepID=A0A917DDH8_9FLAO|nr:tyrosine-type recombinase/integrase [Flavobacterium orientale]GGD28834.1 transposase [Flavobacterium orientale]